jgi:hypothetical protein
MVDATFDRSFEDIARVGKGAQSFDTERCPAIEM